MGLEERIAALEEENQRLKKYNQKLMDIISQMKITLNRLISRYVIENQ